MKVYVIEEFTRNDETCEHGSSVVDVYTEQSIAIKNAKEYAVKHIDYYGHMREDEESENELKYYCCLDCDPDNKKEYANYMVVTVTEHELKEEK